MGHLTLRVIPFLLIVLLGTLGGLVYALNKTPVYTATAHVIVVSARPGPDQLAVNFAQAYGRLAAKRQTLAWALNPAVPDHGANAPKHVKAATSPDTPLIQLTGSGRTADRAVVYANAAADALVRYGTSRAQETGVRVAFMSAADRPSKPTSPNLLLSLAVGTATGVLLAGLLGTIASGIRGQFREYRRLHPEHFPSGGGAPPEPPDDATTHDEATHDDDTAPPTEALKDTSKDTPEATPTDRPKTAPKKAAKSTAKKAPKETATR